MKVTFPEIGDFL
jgi:hypothetical protein